MNRQTEVRIVGWMPGLLKISTNELLRKRAGLSLDESKELVDRILPGNDVAISVDPSEARQIVSDLRAFGAIVVSPTEAE